MQKLHRTVRLGIHRKVRRITGRKLQRNRLGDCALFTSERLGVPASSVQTLIDTNTGLEMLEVAEKNLLGNIAEVKTYFINL